MLPGAIERRDRGGGQSQAQGAQEEAAMPCWKGRDFLSFQWRAGAETKSAEATAKVTKLHFNHGPGPGPAPAREGDDDGVISRFSN